MNVYVCVCMFVCMYVCTYVRMLNRTVPYLAHNPTNSSCAHSHPARLPGMQQTDSEARTLAKRSSGLLLTDSEHQTGNTVHICHAVQVSAAT